MYIRKELLFKQVFLVWSTKCSTTAKNKIGFLSSGKSSIGVRVGVGVRVRVGSKVVFWAVFSLFFPVLVTQGANVARTDVYY